MSAPLMNFFLYLRKLTRQTYFNFYFFPCISFVRVSTVKEIRHLSLHKSERVKSNKFKTNRNETYSLTHSQPSPPLRDPGYSTARPLQNNSKRTREHERANNPFVVVAEKIIVLFYAEFPQHVYVLSLQGQRVTGFFQACNSRGHSSAACNRGTKAKSRACFLYTRQTAMAGRRVSEIKSLSLKTLLFFYIRPMYFYVKPSSKL